MRASQILGLFLAAAIATTAPTAFVPAAFAQNEQARALVNSAKEAGVVGEQGDGFLGFVKGGGDPALKAAVDEINTGRAQLYRDAAAKNGVSPEAAGASAFSSVVQARLKPGEYFKPLGGAWQRK
jgi:uncharacterized protein YdbL (DUF1318 family)